VGGESVVEPGEAGGGERGHGLTMKARAQLLLLGLGSFGISQSRNASWLRVWR
jgi:hypothetical protein